MRRIHWLLLAPAVGGALLISVLETGVLFPPANPLTADISRLSFPEAIARQGVEEAYAYVRAGHDPNHPILFEDARLTGGRTLRLAPLVVALAARNDNTAMMLLTAGADPSLPGQLGVACLAEWVDLPDLARLIRAARGGDAPCPPKPPAGTALAVAFAQ